MTTSIGDMLKDGLGRYDTTRIMPVLGVLVFLVLSAYTVIWQKKPWDPQSYGTGLGLVFTGAGAWMRMKPAESPAGGNQ